MYRIYYHLESKEKYLAVEDADLEDDVEKSKKLSRDISSSKDSVFIYDEEKMCKVVVSFDAGGDLFFEIQTSNGILYRYIDFGELDTLLDNFSDVMQNAEVKYGFSAESI